MNQSQQQPDFHMGFPRIPVKFLPLEHCYKLPELADPGCSGYDLYAVKDAELWPRDTGVFPLGFKLEIPPGWELQVRPRSGIALKHRVTVLNTPGTVDSSYRGEVGVILANFGDEIFKVSRGDRIAQGVFCPVFHAVEMVVSELSGTVRGEGGLGHTGR